MQIEGPALLNGGFNAAIAKVGMQKFVSDLFWVGMFYHLYNQVCNTILKYHVTFNICLELQYMYSTRHSLNVHTCIHC